MPPKRKSTSKQPEQSVKTSDKRAKTARDEGDEGSSGTTVHDSSVNLDSLPQVSMDLICSVLAARKMYEELQNLRVVSISIFPFILLNFQKIANLFFFDFFPIFVVATLSHNQANRSCKRAIDFYLESKSNIPPIKTIRICDIIDVVCSRLADTFHSRFFSIGQVLKWNFFFPKNPWFFTHACMIFDSESFQNSMKER